MVEIDKRLYQEIKDYCKLNNLVIKDFVSKLLRKAFTIEKYGEKPFSNIDYTSDAKEDVVFMPYVLDDTPQVVVMPEPIKNELPEKVKERFNKPLSNKCYSDGLLKEMEPNGVIGKMELPDEPPYNNVMVTTEHIKELETQVKNEIKNIVEVEPEKEEPKPQVVKKSRKRKLN